MKKIFSIICICMLPFSTEAQTISKITLVPPNPTPFDSLTFLVDVHFTSGGCAAYITNSGQTGNQLFGYALHCVGPLTVICDVTDTFYFPPLPTGAYMFTFQVDAGGAPAPCTPGIVAGPSDSLTFLVNPTYAATLPGDDRVRLYPNPARGTVYLKVQAELNAYYVQLQVFDLGGRQVATLLSLAHERALPIYSRDRHTR